METTGLNYWAILVSALAYMMLGAIWYSPVLFGNSWLRGIGKTKEQVRKDFKSINFLLAIIMSFIAAYGIARVMLWMDSTTVADGIMVSVLIGICFVFTTMSVNDIFENRPGSLTFINVLYHLMGFIVIGVIVGAWR
ncbi:MAG: DUF1761 domain-containing protein [Candidatus Zixiibacteriota bacterium]